MNRFLIFITAIIICVGITQACSASKSENEIVNQKVSTGAGQINSDANAEATPKAESSKQTDVASTFKKGDDYKKIVREKLLKNGWKAARAEDADVCGSSDSTCDEFPEMNHCAGTGMGNCEFRWQKDGKILLIFTVNDPHVFDSYEFEKTSAANKSNDVSGKYSYRYAEDYGGEISFNFKPDKKLDYDWAQEDVTWKGDGNWTWDEAKQTLTATVFTEPDVETAAESENTPPRKEVFVFRKSGNDLKLITPPPAMNFYKGKTFQKK